MEEKTSGRRRHDPFPMAVTSISDEENPPQHQVFINYRGDELRKSFLGFLVKAMRDARINVFTDETEVKGRDLQNLFRRIEGSRVAVAILSERYTESSWCLDELVKMKERIDENKLVVIPIFYRLDANNCQSINHQTQTNIVQSFETLMAELDRLPSRCPQVFVSFCKEELGDNFVRHLVWALRDSGINVFTDSYKLRGREEEQQVVFTAIEQSNIALATFIKRYHESDWCLNELVKMDKLAKEGKLVVIPVFYNVKTNEVRRLEGGFGIHFEDTKRRFAMEPTMLQSWEESLNSVIKRRNALSLEKHRNEFALVATIVREAPNIQNIFGIVVLIAFGVF